MHYPAPHLQCLRLGERLAQPRELLPYRNHQGGGRARRVARGVAVTGALHMVERLRTDGRAGQRVGQLPRFNLGVTAGRLRRGDRATGDDLRLVHHPAVIAKKGAARGVRAPQAAPSLAGGRNRRPAGSAAREVGRPVRAAERSAQDRVPRIHFTFAVGPRCGVVLRAITSVPASPRLGPAQASPPALPFWAGRSHRPAAPPVRGCGGSGGPDRLLRRVEERRQTPRR